MTVVEYDSGAVTILVVELLALVKLPVCGIL